MIKLKLFAISLVGMVCVLLALIYVNRPQVGDPEITWATNLRLRPPRTAVRREEEVKLVSAKPRFRAAAPALGWPERSCAWLARGRRRSRGL